MTTDLVSYRLAEGVATITLDDGKSNALSPQMFKQIYAALERAQADQAIVIITGRAEVFSAGFDLKVLRAGGPQAIGMLKTGYSLTARLLSYPYPTIAACNGHVLAMGLFMMLSCDYVIGSAGDYKVAANEVAIGLPMPRVAEAVLRHRLRPADFQRATVLAEYFPMDRAQAAGFFDDQVEAPDQLLPRAREKAAEFARLDSHAHQVTKRRVRSQTLSRIRRSLPLDLKDAVVLGVRAAVSGRGQKKA